MADINVTEEIIDINVTEEVITIEAPTGAYPFPNAVFSVFGRVGSIVAAEGDYSLTQLSDVTLTSPANGQVLKYNGTAWVNSTDADTGITTLNTLTALTQTFATGTSGTDFAISSATSTHTFNLPTASAVNRGALSSADWTTFNGKESVLTFSSPLVRTTNTISIPAATSLVDGYLDNLDWVKFNTAYNDSIISAAVTGTTTKTLTLNQQDGGTVTASWTDDNTDAVTSVFGRTGAVVATSGDYTTTQVTEGTNLYFTDTRARAAISLTTTGTSGAATYTSGVINIPQYQGVLTNPVTGTGTTNTLPKFTAASTIGNSNITDTGSLITLGSNSYVNGALGIGTTSITSGNVNLFLAKNLTGDVNVFSVNTESIIQSDVTTHARYFTAVASTAAAAFTLPELTYYEARQGTFGAGSTVGTQQGFVAGTTLIDGTNNYGFRGRIPSGTNRWNLYMDGTANNYMAGSLGIGTTSLTQANLFINKNLTGSTTMYGILNMGQVQSGVTTNANYFATFATVQNTAFTLGEFVHYRADSAGSYGSATITNQYGFFVQNTLTGATNNYGFYGNIASGTNRWNLYMNGTANNFMAGNLGLGNTGLNNVNLRLGNSITGSTSSFAILNGGTIQSGVTTLAAYNSTSASTVAATFTLTDLHHYRAFSGTFGAGSVVTNQYGFFVDASLTEAANDYGFYGNIGAAANRWNLYMAGTAANYLAGNLGIGATNADVFSRSDSRILGISGSANTSLGINAATGSSAFLQLGVNNTRTFQLQSNATETFLGTGTATPLIFTIAFNERMRLDANGALGIGTSSLTGYTLRLNKQLTGNVDVYGVANTAQAQSSATTTVRSFYSLIGTQATSYTLADLMHYWAEQDTIGAGSIVTRQYGFYVHSSLTGATNNYGFYGNIASGANRWNLYMAGTAANYMAGNLTIGQTAYLAGTYSLDVTTGGIAGISDVARFATNGNGGAGRGVGIVLGASGSTNTVSVARLVGYQETASATANNASFAIQVANSSGTLTERVRVKTGGQMRFVPLASDPSGAEAGDVYYNSTTNKLKVYNGTAWETITSA